MIPRVLIAAATVVAVLLLLIRLDALRSGDRRQLDIPPDLSTIDLTRVDPKKLSNAAPVAESIKTFEQRVDANPSSFIDYTLLGQLHLRSARETGDLPAILRAEAAFKRALDINPFYESARAGLAVALYDQHLFREAANMASLVLAKGNSVQAVATLADARFAMGMYAEAEQGYAELERLAPGPSTQVRSAQIALLKGDNEGALRLLEGAAAAEYASGSSAEGVAWYLTRLADAYFSFGRLDEAAAHYEAALRLNERQPASLAGLARVRAAQGDFEKAIALYVRSVDLLPQPAVVAQLGDVFAKLGQIDEAHVQYDTVALIGTLAALNRNVFNRELALFYADHGLNLDEAVRLARAELEVRKDIYGRDALAWALYQAGMYAEAQAEIARALEYGTLDASLHFHAGVIKKAAGDSEGAMSHLETALRINPYFSLLWADHARQELAAPGSQAPVPERARGQ
ncbi:MAG: tetratricopeptide repeat protein [Chloroflexi bacterium]|nr:tetratricopeptide repeat protein [Chloroflexota bacterium]